ncbi:MAG: dTDP-4-dehydrorhamnose 3,5-epimerase family protein [Nitrospirae bacterium]|nr:dTDP-4-dehydrorhamnose 3,5-epimerase family protein [Nitrospirota bacterium]MBI5694997.1 dTDP-4-dehydrorhamnose 3,5-epimerase family protein [Nitrospirota bacterium]
MIDGVKVKKLRMFPDERGRLMEIIRADDPEFVKFGQVYVTAAYPGVTKAWHYHKLQYDNFCCIKGMMKVVLYDSREGSATKGEVNEFFMGDHNHMMLQIPPMVYHGFKCISETEALIINCCTEMYDYKNPDEYRLDPHDNDIPYDWSRKDG